MPNSNSSTSLYSFTNTVRVSANNFTTLYNATPSNVDVASVSDRNFTTLYNKQSEINPTKAYGNANVEAFLNAGQDQGGNVVENINANGNISGNVIIARTEANLGLVGNVYIGGGGLNYFLTTDGSGGLAWEPPIIQYGNAIPFINFNVTANANNQTFSNTLLSAYTSNTVMNVMKNGVNIEPDLYAVSGNILTVNIPLTVGDSIDVLSTQASDAGNPGGTQFAVQVNDGTGGFYGDAANFSFQPSGSFGGQYAVTARHLSVTGNIIANNNITAANISVTGNTNVSNLNVGNIANLGTVANVRIFGGSANYLLKTDGLGNLSWIDPTVTSATSLNATIANVRITGGLNGYVLQTDGAGNLTWTAQTGGGGGNGVPGGSNTQVQYNDAGNFAGNSSFTFDSTTEVVSVNTLAVTTSISFDGTEGNLYMGTSGNILTDSTLGMTFSIPTGVGNFQWYGPAGANAMTFTSGGLTVPVGVVSPNIGNASSNIIGNGASLFSINGANVSEVANANYASSSATAFSIDGANVTGAVALATLANTANIANTVDGPNVTGYVPNADYATIAGTAGVANSVAGGNVIGFVDNATQATYADYGNSVVLANVVGIGNIAGINISGSNTDVLYGNGVFGVFTVPPGGTNSQVQFNNNGVMGGVGTMTYDVGANTLNGTFANIVSLGNLTVQRAFEKYTPNGTGLASSFNYDAITQSIINVTANATANTTLNFRGNSTITMNTLLSTNQAVTLVLLSKIGNTPYIVTTVQVDGTTVTPTYLGGLSPLVGTRQSNSVQSYTYTILKSAANTYTVLGSFAEFV